MKLRSGRREWQTVSGVEFKDARIEGGLSRQQAARVLHVSDRTIRNWEIPNRRVPRLAHQLLRIHYCYELPGEAWRGWRLVGDRLYSPERLAFAAHEAAWWSLTCAMARQWLRQYDGRLNPFIGPQRPLAQMFAERAAQAGGPGPVARRSAADMGRGARTREPQQVAP